jgi:hypothetical protein
MAHCPVAIVCAMDSAGFFAALYDGLSRAQGLTVHFIPAACGEAEINLQAERLPAGNLVDISRGAYPSGIGVRENREGRLPCASPGLDHAGPRRRVARLSRTGTCDLPTEIHLSHALAPKLYHAC